MSVTNPLYEQDVYAHCITCVHTYTSFRFNIEVPPQASVWGLAVILETNHALRVVYPFFK